MKNFEKKKQNEFEFENVLKNADKAMEDPQNITIEPICELLIEFTYLLNHMGRLLSLAFSDITTKVSILREIINKI